jgi:hypothetical protein
MIQARTMMAKKENRAAVNQRMKENQYIKN